MKKIEERILSSLEFIDMKKIRITDKSHLYYGYKGEYQEETVFGGKTIHHVKVSSDLQPDCKFDQYLEDGDFEYIED